ncbi:Reticulocyte-binding protein 2-like protein a, partial [Bienertia sinuspersici]
EGYERNVAECEQSGVQKDPNQVYLETVGGRKKGKVPGLGTSAGFYYGTSSKGKGTSSTSSSTPSIVSQLSQRLEESDRAREAWEREYAEKMEAQRLAMEKQQMEWMQAREEERRQEREYLEEMRRTMDTYGQMFSQCSGFTPRSDDHHDQPPPSGSTGPCCA